MSAHLLQRKSLVNLLVTRLTASWWQSPEQLPSLGPSPGPNSAPKVCVPHSWNWHESSTWGRDNSHPVEQKMEMGNSFPPLAQDH